MFLSFYFDKILTNTVVYLFMAFGLFIFNLLSLPLYMCGLQQDVESYLHQLEQKLGIIPEAKLNSILSSSSCE